MIEKAYFWSLSKNTHSGGKQLTFFLSIASSSVAKSLSDYPF
jgi:hypothetical protein